MPIKSAIKKFIGKVKENYNYYKLGRKAEFDEEQKKTRERTQRWMDNIRRGTPEENLK
jgi:hypothetical protein